MSALTFYETLVDYNRKLLKLFYQAVYQAFPLALAGLFILALPMLAYIPTLAFENLDERANLVITACAILALIPAAMCPLLLKVHAIATQRQLGLHKALKQGAACFPQAMCGGIIYVILVFSGWILLVVPGMILLFRLFPWWVEVAVFRTKVTKAFSASFSMTAGRWWRIFMYVCPLIGFNFGTENLANKVSAHFSEDLGMLTMLVATPLVLIFLCTTVVCIYLDCQQQPTDQICAEPFAQVE
jgi:hypothetical protein